MNSIQEDLPVCDAFKQVFKYYKSNDPPPRLDNVLSVSKEEICCVSRYSKDDPRTVFLGLKKFADWKLFSVQKHPGLLFIKNPFTSFGQRFWIRKCLEEYPKAPHRLNIDVEYKLKDWWNECHKNMVCNKKLRKKLRWTTLGYHHNWDTKVYSEENRSPFPEDFAELSDVIAQYLGYNDFKAEAAIINYYHMDSNLSPHTDHSEINLAAPLFSISFGQSAIFLIGGKNKSEEPSAIMLNSGDIVIMSEEARLCYHAVPRILPATNSPWNDNDDFTITQVNELKYITKKDEVLKVMKETTDNKLWNDFNDYVKESRINMNVRQVLNHEQKNISALNS